MKNDMKRTILLLAAICCMAVANAGNSYATKIEYEEGKIMYFSLRTSDMTAYVTWGGIGSTTGTDEYKGDIRIPSIVNYEGTDYQVTGISDYAFCGCTDLTSVTLPEGMIQISGSAFQGCTNLRSVTLPEGLDRILSDAFHGCTSLTSIALPEGLTNIGFGAFRNCTGMTSITMPSTVTKIGDYAFDGMTQLQGVYILSDSLQTVGTKAWNTQIPTYVTGLSYNSYKAGILRNYPSLKIMPGDGNIGTAIKSYLNLTDEETAVFNRLLKVYDTMGTRQAGPVIDIEGEDGKTLRLYRVKGVTFGQENE